MVLFTNDSVCWFKFYSFLRNVSVKMATWRAGPSERWLNASKRKPDEPKTFRSSSQIWSFVVVVDVLTCRSRSQILRKNNSKSYSNLSRLSGSGKSGLLYDSTALMISLADSLPFVTELYNVLLLFIPLITKRKKRKIFKWHDHPLAHVQRVMNLFGEREWKLFLNVGGHRLWSTTPK